jgi:hypothetical protein
VLISPNIRSFQKKQNSWDTGSSDKVFNLYVTRLRWLLSLTLRHPKQETYNKISQFINIVNFYRDMWLLQTWFSNLDSLTSLTWVPRSSLNGTHPFNMNFIKSRKSLELRYMLFSAIQTSVRDFIFIVINNASDHQLRAINMQDKKPIGFYSQNLNKAQRGSKTTEMIQELLSAVETCKEKWLSYEVTIDLSYYLQTSKCSNY